MQLSNRAHRYFEKLRRDLKFTCNREVTVHYLQKQGFPVFEPIVNFQTDLSGFTLPVTDKPSKAFTASLFSLKDIKRETHIDAIQINSKYYFLCGDLPTAPFTFVLSEDGEICSYDGYGDEVNPIYSSGELLIENFALQDYLAKDAVELPQYLELLDGNALEQMVIEHGQFSRANDKYNTWYMADQVVVHKGTWLDRPKFYVHIYGKSLEEAKSFYSRLKEKKIID